MVVLLELTLGFQSPGEGDKAGRVRVSETMWEKKKKEIKLVD